MKEQHVRIGEVKVTRKGEYLKATLGSCVGIAFYWRDRKCGGLAHCLLPNSPTEVNDIGAKYVNQAVHSLIILMKIKPENFKEIEVTVAGGGNMMGQLSKTNLSQVGKENAKAVLAVLSKLGFKIKHSDLQSNYGRVIELDCSDGSVNIIQLNNEQAG